MFEVPDSSGVIALALAEDLGVSPEAFARHSVGLAELFERDVTSFAAVGMDARFAGRIVARQACTVAGLPVVAAVFETLSSAAGLADQVEVFPLVAEGSRVAAGTAVAEVEGVAVAVLAGERTALDFMMMLSGIATETAAWVAVAGPGVAVCDTRKTAPGLRELSKYAVLVGGGINHRHGLYDMVLIKDNHISSAGDITAAVARARAAHSGLLIAVEADTAAQAFEVVRAGADMLLLDNFDDGSLAETVAAVRAAAEEAGRTILIEASGGITRDRLPALRAAGVDRVSSSALTMGVRTIDFGLDEARVGDGD